MNIFWIHDTLEIEKKGFWGEPDNVSKKRKRPDEVTQDMASEPAGPPTKKRRLSGWNAFFTEQVKGKVGDELKSKSELGSLWATMFDE